MVVKEDFKAHFPKTGIKDMHHTANRVKVTLEHFNQIPEEEQLHIVGEAKLDHEKALKSWKEALTGAPY